MFVSLLQNKSFLDIFFNQINILNNLKNLFIPYNWLSNGRCFNKLGIIIKYKQSHRKIVFKENSHATFQHKIFHILFHYYFWAKKCLKKVLKESLKIQIILEILKIVILKEAFSPLNKEKYLHMVLIFKLHRNAI